MTYSELQSTVADWLNRGDLTSVIPTFIENAENALRRDPRIRRLRTQDLTIAAETVNLPANFRAIESLYIDGNNDIYGEIEIMSPGMLAETHRRHSTADYPRSAAVLDQTTLRVAPAPDQAYTFKLTYWETIPRLGDNILSNWLLARDQDIYIYATLVESAPYLRDDPRVATWRSELERRIEEFHANVERGQFSGTLTRRPYQSF